MFKEFMIRGSLMVGAIVTSQAIIEKLEQRSLKKNIKTKEESKSEEEERAAYERELKMMREVLEKHGYEVEELRSEEV